MHARTADGGRGPGGSDEATHGPGGVGSGRHAQRQRGGGHHGRVAWHGTGRRGHGARHHRGNGRVHPLDDDTAGSRGRDRGARRLRHHRGPGLDVDHDGRSAASALRVGAAAVDPHLGPDDVNRVVDHHDRAPPTAARDAEVPEDWPADQPIPPMPEGCQEPHLEDNGVLELRRRLAVATDEERADRIRRLQERRGSASPAAALPRPPGTATSSTARGGLNTNAPAPSAAPPATPRRRRRHAAPAGRVLAAGLSASAFLGGVAVLGTHPKTSSGASGAGAADAVSDRAGLHRPAPNAPAGSPDRRRRAGGAPPRLRRLERQPSVGLRRAGAERGEQRAHRTVHPLDRERRGLPHRRPHPRRRHRRRLPTTAPPPPPAPSCSGSTC